MPTLEANYRTLVSWIQDRGKKAGKVPKIVFTNYHDPFPPPGVTCPDSNDRLYPDQVQYLSSLIGQLNGTVQTTIQSLNDPNVVLADISQSMTASDGTSHRWCTDDPWAYGLSIYSAEHPTSFESQAPFHPTPDGHRRIAQLLLPVVDGLFTAAGGGATTTTDP